MARQRKAVEIGRPVGRTAHTRGPGRIVIGKYAFLCANRVVTARPGKVLTIGEGAVIAALSAISDNVPPRAFHATERARHLADVVVPLKKGNSHEDFVAGLRPVRKK